MTLNQLALEQDDDVRQKVAGKTPRYPGMTQRDYEAWVSRLKVIGLGLAVLALVAVSLGLAYYR